MKTLISIVLGAGTLLGAVLYLKRPQAAPVPAIEAVAEPAAGEQGELQSIAQPIPRPQHKLKSPATTLAQPTQHLEPGLNSTPTNLDAAMLNQAVEMLVSTQAPYGEKQTHWKRLRETGKLDQVIKCLEERMAADPGAPQYPATLGQAYLKKCATLQDVREQGILAMQADKLFDLALNLDPANWEARFTKAVGLSYWPAEMKKSAEVIEHFQTLIQQQETQTPQSHYAEAYVLLGTQYDKAGRADYARAVWERGASLFPNHEGLKSKLSALEAPQTPSSASAQY